MTSVTIPEIDLKEAFLKTRLSGLWRLLKGYRFVYLIATICIGFAAMSRAGTYMLLQRFIDNLINPSETMTHASSAPPSPMTPSLTPVILYE